MVASGLKRNYSDPSQDPDFSTVVELDISTVVPSCSGPKRPHDRVAVKDMKKDFVDCLNNPIGFKGFGIASDKISKTVPFHLDGQEYTLNHGSVLIAAITSCTNTSNPRYCDLFYFKFYIYTNKVIYKISILIIV